MDGNFPSISFGDLCGHRTLVGVAIGLHQNGGPDNLAGGHLGGQLLSGSEREVGSHEEVFGPGPGVLLLRNAHVDRSPFYMILACVLTG